MEYPDQTDECMRVIKYSIAASSQMADSVAPPANFLLPNARGGAGLPIA